MSELSAKHRALTLLRSLATEKTPRSSSPRTSPRVSPRVSPRATDLSGSQEVLAGKYRELATLLAVQHSERKTFSRLQSVDLVAAGGTSGGGRRHRRNGNRRLRTEEQREAEPDRDEGPKIVEIPAGEDESKYLDPLPSRDESSSSPPPTASGRKTVTFSVAGDDVSSATGNSVSDAEVIRCILQSPRRVFEAEAVVTPRPPSKPRRRRAALRPSKRGPCKGGAKVAPVEAPPARSKSPNRSSSEAKRPPQVSDNKLSSSGNPDVRSWLRAKNKVLRRQRREERRKERKEEAEEQRQREERLRRRAESEDTVTLWMREKRSETLLQRRVRREVRNREASDAVKKVADSNRMPSPGKDKPGPVKDARTALNATKSRRKPVSKENVAPSDDRSRLEEEEVATRHHLVRNLESERLRAEEKRQRKEAERRRKKLLAAEQGKEEDPTKTKKAARRASSKTPGKTGGAPDVGDGKKAPSPDPAKRVSYDQWCRQKQADQRKRAKEAKKEEVGDPELDDLIPLLARRRIEQIKVRAARVDSGLRRSRDGGSPETAAVKPEGPNGVRPYTWRAPPGSKTTPARRAASPRKNERTAREKNPVERTGGVASQGTAATAAAVPDVASSERPEPQGCEGTGRFSCPSADRSERSTATATKPPNQADATDRSSEKIHSKNEQLDNDDSPERETTFLTEQTV